MRLIPFHDAKNFYHIEVEPDDGMTLEEAIQALCEHRQHFLGIVAAVDNEKITLYWDGFQFISNGETGIQYPALFKNYKALMRRVVSEEDAIAALWVAPEEDFDNPIEKYIGGLLHRLPGSPRR